MLKKTILISCTALLLIASACEKDEDSDPSGGTPPTNNTGLFLLGSGANHSVEGNLNLGSDIADLSWAWSGNMACFVEPGAHFFTGNHVFYQKELPTNSVATITLIPDDSSSKMALYAYTKASGNMDLPPEVYSCVACEADPSNNNGTLTGTRSVELVAINNPYSIIIGVAGGDESMAGGYTLLVEVES